MVGLTATQIKASMRAKAQRNANAVYRAKVARTHMSADRASHGSMRDYRAHAHIIVAILCAIAVAVAYILAR